MPCIWVLEGRRSDFAYSLPYLSYLDELNQDVPSMNKPLPAVITPSDGNFLTGHTVVDHCSILNRRIIPTAVIALRIINHFIIPEFCRQIARSVPPQFQVVSTPR